MQLKPWASLVLLIACTRLSEVQRSALEADAEAFESIVRSQVADSAAGSLGFLRVDARPSVDDAVLAGTVEPPRTIELGQSPDSLTPLMKSIEDQRRSILGTLKVDEGGPFDYPYCGGARRVSDSADVTTASKCPGQPVRYVTVGAPFHGAAPLLQKLRRPESPVPDSSAELWTLLVSETNVGPGGQQWRQYAWLFRRDRETGRLAVAERFLVSWAE